MSHDEQVLTHIQEYLIKYTGQAQYWYPLATLKEDVPVVTYDLDRLYANGQVVQIENVFRSCGISLVFSFQLQSHNLKLRKESIFSALIEKDADGYCFPWRVETFLFDQSKAWMVYVSHEGSITFTGAKICEAAIAHIDQQYCWKGANP